MVVPQACAASITTAEPGFFARMASFYARHDWPEIFPHLRRRPDPASAFYDDPDPKLEGLAAIAARTLVVTAELDAIMLAPSREILAHAPGAREAHLPAVGHMTALECPEALALLVLGFLRPDLNPAALYDIAPELARERVVGARS